MNWTVYYAQGLELLFLGIGSYLDMKSRELPIKFFVFFGVTGIFYNTVCHYQSIASMVFGACIGGMILIIGWITKEAIGYGDGLGILVLGIMEGAMGVLPILFVAFCLSGVYGMWKMYGLKSTRGDTFPFFPFLFMGFMGEVFL